MSPQPKAAKEPFIFSTITKATDTYPVAKRGTWADLIAHVENNIQMIPLTEEEFAELQARAKSKDKGEADEAKAALRRHKDGPAFILCEFDGYRDEERARKIYGAGFDFDSGNASLEAIRACLHDVAAIIYETASSRPDAQRWRVIVPYSHGLTVAEAREQWEVISQRFPKAWLDDESGHDPTRLWFGRVRFRDGKARRMEVLAGSPHEPAKRVTRSPQEAFRRHIKPPVDEPVADGRRNTQLSRYCASLLARNEVASEEELFEALLEQGATYSPPYGEKSEERGEIRRMARNKWKRRSKFTSEAPPTVEIEEADDTGFFLDISAMARAKPEGPHWIIPGWIPGGTVTLHSGDGGCGKSLVDFDIAIALALGIDVFGKPCQRRKVMVVSAEDDEDILHWRMDKICRKYKRKVEELEGWLFIRDATGDANVLFTDNKFTGATWTDRTDLLFEAMQACGASLMILDNASDHYDANENERAKVRQFITGFNARLSREQAVLLLAHVDAVTAMNPHDSKGYSGSTAWNNSVRSRWFQYRDKETGKIVLALKKSNYAQAGEMVEIEWDDACGTFVIGEAQRPAASLDEHAALFLRLIDETLEAGVTISPAPQATNNPVKRLKGHPKYPKGAAPAQVFSLIEKLIVGGFLQVHDVTGRNGKKSRQLSLTPKGRENMGKGED